MILFPTDLASFLELIRQHGEAAYSFVFAFATSHSLLMTLFAGYTAFSGVFSLGTLIVVCWLGSFCGDVVRFWIARRSGLLCSRAFRGSNAPCRSRHAWRTGTTSG